MTFNQWWFIYKNPPKEEIFKIKKYLFICTPYFGILLGTYSIIHAYFALVQGSSHYVSSPSFLYPSWFLFIFPLFFKLLFMIPFLNSFTGNSFLIPMVKNTIKSKKCVRTEALLGTYVHFCSYFPLFFRTAVYGYHFWQFFLENSFPVKNTFKSKKSSCTQALLSAIF